MEEVYFCLWGGRGWSGEDRFWTKKNYEQKIPTSLTPHIGNMAKISKPPTPGATFR